MKTENTISKTACWTGGPDARIGRRYGSPTLIVNGEPVPPMWMTTGALGVDDEAYLRDLGRAGLRVFFPDHLLFWNGAEAIERLCTQAERILRVVPDSWIVLRTGLYPPPEWLEAHPQELIQFEDGTPADTWFGKGKHIQCLASRRWREDQSRELDRFLEWLPQQAFAQRVIGIFLNAGGTGEWYVPVPMVQGERCIDHSPAFRTQFSALLRETYGSDEALRIAWNRPDASIESPIIPSCADWAALDEERAQFAHYHGEGELPPSKPGVAAAFSNPYTQRHVVDFYRALNQGSADSIIHFAHQIKARTAGTKVVGAFYGAFAPPSAGVSSAVTRVLDSGVVDFLASPGDYPNRKPGGDTALHNILDSYRLRNTIYVVEEDTRTLAMNPSHDWGVNTLLESNEVIKRDFGRNLAEDLCAWWFDMSGYLRVRRWYGFPKMQEIMRRQQEVARAAYQAPRAPAAEIAFIYDQESLCYTGSWTLADLGTRMRSWEIHRIGAPVAYHYLEDLERPDMPDYKLYVFVNAFALNDQRRQAIQRYLGHRACTVLWLYAPGIINPERDPRLDVQNVIDLTGLRAGSLPGPALPYCRLTPRGAERLPDARTDLDYGWFVDRESSGTVESWLQPQGLAQFSLLSPYLFGDDPDAEVLLRFTADDRPALLLRERQGQRTLIAYFKALHADLFRSAARLAGCHLYCTASTADDVLYASPQFVTLHASSSGEKTIRLPVPCVPYEIYELKAYGQGVSEIRCRMRKGETRTFHLHGAI